MPVFKGLLQKQLHNRLAASRNRLYRLAYAWCNDATVSDDLTQDAMTKALRNSRQLKDPAKLDQWLNGILINCWRDHYRSRKEHENIDDYELYENDTPEQQWVQSDQRQRIRHAIAKLPESQRMVVTLVDIDGTSYADVAETMQIPIGTVMSRLCRARKTLIQRLQDLRQVTATVNTPYLRRVK
ncbi:MAG TPA: sigma-70 family RNA polymerase sigma factor [Gammaproteobacteria bacterium]|nr:sigma-70 family RNA polymerase sigma factor [Gammaproteobacteria bacterium]